jgi:hypothetical protein
MRYLFFGLFALAVIVTAFRPRQDFTVTGTVKDQNGQPLANVTVTEAQSHRSTVTKEDGSFSLKVSTTHIVLMFRLVGYNKTDFSPVDITKPINIQLNASVQSLNEVVVLGYGTQRKKDVTGSVTHVNGAAIPSKSTDGFYHSKGERILERKMKNIFKKTTIQHSNNNRHLTKLTSWQKILSVRTAKATGQNSCN